ncbi:MAG: hypothetical protein LC620_07015, partial [Halobacteriales archaeon]|nr:hypothetical protein [Halobacteriales archaeon]
MRRLAAAVLAVLLSGCMGGLSGPSPHSKCTEWRGTGLDRAVYAAMKAGPRGGAEVTARPPSVPPLPFHHPRLDAAWGAGNYSLLQAIWGMSSVNSRGDEDVLVRDAQHDGFKVYALGPGAVAAFDRWAPDLLGHDANRTAALRAGLGDTTIGIMVQGPVVLDEA